MTDNEIWNRSAAFLRIALLKLAIDNEILSRESASDRAVFIAVGETIRRCELLVEEALERCPGYTSEISLAPAENLVNRLP